LSLVGETDLDAAAARKILPGWLSAILAAIDAGARRSRSPDRTSSVAALVKQARDSLMDKTGQSLPAELNPPSISAERKAARRRWSSKPAWSELLPGLVERLARLEALEAEFQQAVESEKLQSLKELAYGAGHEINNPLANISARAQTLLAEERDPERRRKLATINTQAFRAHEMIADMMLFARPPQLKREHVELVGFVGALIDQLQDQAAQQETSLVFRASREPQVAWVDAAQIAVALRALCTNSLEALARGGRIEVGLQNAAPATPDGADSAGSVQLTVADDGPGISPEVRRHLFDPFYCGREAGRGLGFGLSKCWRIVTDHGGRIDVASQVGGGARFTLTIPRDGN
jgi:signal transduction histidine kinase